LASAVERTSELSRYHRFHTGLSGLSDQMVATLTDIDHHDHDALIALPPSSGRIVGLARFLRAYDRTDTAEITLEVADAWQRRGLATLLLGQLAERAAAVGIERFTATVLTENAPAIALLTRMGGARFTSEGSALSARMRPAQLATGREEKRLVVREPSRPDVVLLPRLLRAWLDVSSGLTHTMAFPVSIVPTAASHDGIE
jgi:RimJ/RimL family protein N-acetyltransferase